MSPVAILRAVVHQDDFVVGIRQLLERAEVVLERVGCVVRADDHRHTRPRGLGLDGERRALERVGDRLERRLRPPFAVDESERPILDRVPSAPPLVGPGKRDRAARAFLERRADVHRRDLGLTGFAFANRVGAGFSKQQRLVARDVLQAREIRAQLWLAVQVHVERADVEEREVEEFGRREVDVREERLRRGVLRVLIQAPQEPLDAHAPVPADHAGRYFVAEREHEHGWMAAEVAHLRGQLAPDSLLQSTIVEEGDVLRPGEPDHHTQPVGRGFVEEPARRRCIGADCVDPEARHQAEVFGNLFGGRELMTIRVGREGPVRDAFDEESFVADAQEFPVGHHATG